jgi:hypothetical protein
MPFGIEVETPVKGINYCLNCKHRSRFANKTSIKSLCLKQPTRNKYGYKFIHCRDKACSFFEYTENVYSKYQTKISKQPYTIYVACKMEGETQEDIQHTLTQAKMYLNHHTKTFTKRDLEIILPTDVVPNGVIDWSDCMDYCLSTIQKCKRVVLTDQCAESKGARIERKVAELLNKKITQLVYDCDGNIVGMLNIN